MNPRTDGKICSEKEATTDLRKSSIYLRKSFGNQVNAYACLCVCFLCVFLDYLF